MDPGAEILHREEKGPGNRIKNYGVHYPVFLYLCYYIPMDAERVHTIKSRFKRRSKDEQPYKVQRCQFGSIA